MSADRAVRAAELAQRLADATPHAVIEAALATCGRAQLAVVSSFGIESAALLKVVADVDRAIPVAFLDTGWLFDETLAYRDTLTARLSLSDVRTIHPDEAAVAARDAERDLYERDPDACCALRKVEPLARALSGFSGWINGRKRYQGGERAEIAMVEDDGVRLKFNPFARIGREDIRKIFDEAHLPEHPLVTFGYRSVGCLPCTDRAGVDEDERAGRWRGRTKSECGIHTMRLG